MERMQKRTSEQMKELREKYDISIPCASVQRRFDCPQYSCEHSAECTIGIAVSESVAQLEDNRIPEIVIRKEYLDQMKEEARVEVLEIRRKLYEWPAFRRAIEDYEQKRKDRLK